MVQLRTRERAFLTWDCVSDGQLLLQTVCSRPVVPATGAAAAAAAASEGRKARFGVQPSPCRERVAPASPAQASSPRQPPTMARLRLGTTRGFSPNKDTQAASKSLTKEKFSLSPLEVLTGDFGSLQFGSFI